jgi:hypothetical protein
MEGQPSYKDFCTFLRCCKPFNENPQLQEVFNILLIHIYMPINAIVMLVDIVAAILFAERGCLAAHDISNMQAAFDTFLDRNRCVLNRYIGFVTFCFRAHFGTAHAPLLLLFWCAFAFAFAHIYKLIFPVTEEEEAEEAEEEGTLTDST